MASIGGRSFDPPLNFEKHIFYVYLLEKSAFWVFPRKKFPPVDFEKIPPPP